MKLLKDRYVILWLTNDVEYLETCNPAHFVFYETLEEAKQINALTGNTGKITKVSFESEEVTQHAK